MRHGRGKDDELVKSIPKSPKKACPRCGKLVANPWAHKNSCKARKSLVVGDATTSGESANPSPIKASRWSSGTNSLLSASQQSRASQRDTPTDEGNAQRELPTTGEVDASRMSNREFLNMYRAWMEGGRGNYAKEKTVALYTSHVRNFIIQQMAQRLSFRARHWLRFDRGNFMQLAGVGGWIPRGTGISNGNQMICAYKHLLALIRHHLVQRSANVSNFAQHTAHLDELQRKASALARKFKSGKFERASELPVKESQMIDIDGWRSLMKAYYRDSRRIEALRRFAGTYP